jgi:hypothetical protein
METFGRNIWDQALTYGHYNLHNTSLFDDRIFLHQQNSDSPSASLLSFAEYCRFHNIHLLAAAPLSMGLLTQHRGPPDWHPASDELKLACRNAAKICQQHKVDISTLALLMALSNPDIPCTVLGMACVEEVKVAQKVACRFRGISQETSPTDILDKVLNEQERKVWSILKDQDDGPFASVWKNGLYRWDGMKEARQFWEHLDETPGDVVDWHPRTV